MRPPCHAGWLRSKGHHRLIELWTCRREVVPLATLSGLVSQAYALALAEIALMWRTALHRCQPPDSAKVCCIFIISSLASGRPVAYWMRS